jgi:hypothetical protein
MSANRNRRKGKPLAGKPSRIEIRGNALHRVHSPKPLEIERWAFDNNINLGMAQLAQEAVVLAKPLYDLSIELQSGRLKAKFPEEPPQDKWLRFYRRHRVLWRTLGNKVTGWNFGSQLVEDHAALRIVIREREQIKKEIARADRKKLRKEIEKQFKAYWRAYQSRVREWRDELASNESELRSDLQSQLRKTPELQFALGVIIPCVVRFRTTPVHLMRRARKGNASAIENLIRLDENTSDDPRIKAWLRSGKGDVRAGRREMKGQWIQEGLAGKISRTRMKQIVAGLISYCAESLAIRLNENWTQAKKYKLTAPKIKELFDAVARDRGIAEPLSGKDRDIADCSLQAWAKAVERYRKMWRDGMSLVSDKR